MIYVYIEKKKDSRLIYEIVNNLLWFIIESLMSYRLIHVNLVKK